MTGLGAWLRRLLDRDPLTYRRIGNVDPSAPFVVTAPDEPLGLAESVERLQALVAVESKRTEVRLRLEALLAEAGITYEPWQIDTLTRALVPYVDIPDQHAYSRRGQTDTDPRRT